MLEKPVLVVGSVNYDLIVNQRRLPRRGETLSASSLRGSFGGKGANQAVQAARLGARVQFIGATGADHYGSMSLEHLRTQGIDCYMCPTTVDSGLGIVHVIGDGEVHATIYEGANAEVGPDWVKENSSLITEAGVVVIQNEIPMETNTEVIEIAAGAGVPVVYNAAPARPVSKEVTRSCRWFVVNEDEASVYLGHSLEVLQSDAEALRAAEDLRTYCGNVILTLGSRGCYVVAGPIIKRVEALPTRAVDTTGAGDSFIGAFAASIMGGADPFLAADEATRVAAITVQGLGAQSSMPTREDLNREAVRSTPDHS